MVGDPGVSMRHFDSFLRNEPSEHYNCPIHFASRGIGATGSGLVPKSAGAVMFRVEDSVTSNDIPRYHKKFKLFAALIRQIPEYAFMDLSGGSPRLFAEG
jgi:hypothetical protein